MLSRALFHLVLEVRHLIADSGLSSILLRGRAPKWRYQEEGTNPQSASAQSKRCGVC